MGLVATFLLGVGDGICTIHNMPGRGGSEYARLEGIKKNFTNQICAPEYLYNYLPELGSTTKTRLEL